MTYLPEEPSIECLNAFGRRFFDVRDCDKEFALMQAQRIWKEQRFAQMTGEEAVETFLRECQEAQDRLFGVPQKPVEAWMNAYEEEWARLCAGECDFEGPYVETYDLWLKHEHSEPKLVAMQRFVEIYTPAERERYRQLTQKKPWIDITAQDLVGSLHFAARVGDLKNTS